MKSKLYFVVAALIPSLLDGIVTLIGQPTSYWSDFSKIDEAAPFTFLTFGPWIFLLSIVLYTAIVGLIIYKLPKWPSLGIGLFFFMAHSNGVQGWIGSIVVEKAPFLYGYWWYISIIYSLLVVALISFGLYKWLSDKKTNRA
jgi:uncharacterized BrkB/YihY/UPF0761 family membrane protein